MARMNVFTVVVCLVMDRPYQFYYFIPLVSFWFMFLYFVLAVPPTLTAETVSGKGNNYAYFLRKLPSYQQKEILFIHQKELQSYLSG